jgi:hypothetical protein
VSASWIPAIQNRRSLGRLRAQRTRARSLAEHDAWQRRLSAYLDTPEGKERQEDLDRRIELAKRLVGRAETLAARTCERCGEPGECCERSSGAWYKSLRATCADVADYEPVPDDDDN